MKCLVLGGGGFIGSSVCDRLLKDGHQVTVFERPRVTLYRMFSENEKVTWITGDLQSAADITNALNDIECVIHLISTTLPKSSNEDPIYDVQSNVISTLNILNEMVKKSIKKIIFISSGGTVYGNPEYTPIDEKHSTNPTVSYGITKLTIEKYLLMYKKLYGLQPIILRVSNPYGERQRTETAQGAIGVFINSAMNNIPIEIWGDGSIVRDYLHISDIADAFSKAIKYNGDEVIFNIGSGIGTSLNEIIHIIQKAMNKKIIVNYKEPRSFDIPISVLECSIARKELNWVPQLNLLNGISLTYSQIDLKHTTI